MKIIMMVLLILLGGGSARADILSGLIDELKEEVPYEEYEKGCVVVEKDGMRTVVREFSGSDRSATFSYKGLGSAIAGADSVYVIHTHPFTSSHRHPGNRVSIPPSMVDIVNLTIRDSQTFVVEDIYKKFVYLVVDDAQNVWRFSVRFNANFVSTVRNVLLEQQGDMRRLASASLGGRHRIFRKMFSGYPHPEHLEEFFDAMESMQRRSDDEAVDRYIAAAAKLGIEVERVL